MSIYIYIPVYIYIYIYVHVCVCIYIYIHIAHVIHDYIIYESLSFVTRGAIVKNIRYSTSKVHNVHRQGLLAVKKTCLDS